MIRLALRRTTWLVCGAVIFGIAALVLVALLNVPPESLPGLQAGVRQAARAGTVLQAALALWVVFRWHRLIAWCRLKGWVRKSEHRRALALRRKAAAALCAYLLLIPIGPVALLQFALSLFY